MKLTMPPFFTQEELDGLTREEEMDAWLYEYYEVEEHKEDIKHEMWYLR